jgi:replicative DNA helicase
MEEFIEERGNNPIDQFGLMGPHERVNELYGSLLRPGNITVVVARAGVGKTQFCMDFCTKVSSINNNVPILHFDNGEMSKEELIVRQCSALSGVPMHLLETGRWRQAGEEIVQKVRDTWNRVKEFKFYYYNVAGHSIDSMLNIIRRFYYSEVGRGNPMIFSFDYIKTTYERQNGASSWETVGRMVDKFKQLIQKELCFNGAPTVAMLQVFKVIDLVSPTIETQKMLWTMKASFLFLTKSHNFVLTCFYFDKKQWTKYKKSLKVLELTNLYA